MKSVEEDLQSTAQRMGAQVDRLYQTIQENGILQSKIQKNLESQVLQTILTSALRYDSNDNFSFDMEELKRLKVSINNIPGISLDAKNFDQWIDGSTGGGGGGGGGESSLTISELMRRFRDIMNRETPEDLKIIHMTPRKIVQRGFFGG